MNSVAPARIFGTLLGMAVTAGVGECPVVNFHNEPWNHMVPLKNRIAYVARGCDVRCDGASRLFVRAMEMLAAMSARKPGVSSQATKGPAFPWSAVLPRRNCQLS